MLRAPVDRRDVASRARPCYEPRAWRKSGNQHATPACATSASRPSSTARRGRKTRPPASCAWPSDTANQRRHYDEAAVGEALTDALASGHLHREDVFFQTKFTYVDGQDHRLPYDPRAPLATQVEQSCASSLQHLGVDYLDCYFMHE